MSESTNPDSPWTQPWFVVAAAVVALIAVLGVVLAVTSGSETNPGPKAASPAGEPSPTPAPTAPPAAAVNASTCGLPDGDQTVPGGVLTDTRWELVGTVAAPTAPDEHGPGTIDDGLRSCFAHSPVGALYAAVNAAAASAMPDLRLSFVERLGAAGPGRDRASELARGDADASSGGVQVAGFTFLNYDRASTAVDLAFAGTSTTGDNGYVHVPIILRWEEGDWKVVFAPDGSLGTGLGPMPNLTGYTAWSGT